MSTPPLGDITSAADDDSQATLTLPRGADVAVATSSGVKSFVKRKGPRQFVPSWDS